MHVLGVGLCWSCAAAVVCSLPMPLSSVVCAIPSLPPFPPSPSLSISLSLPLSVSVCVCLSPSLSLPCVSVSVSHVGMEIDIRHLRSHQLPDFVFKDERRPESKKKKAKKAAAAMKEEEKSVKEAIKTETDRIKQEHATALKQEGHLDQEEPPLKKIRRDEEESAASMQPAHDMSDDGVMKPVKSEPPAVKAEVT